MPPHPDQQYITALLHNDRKLLEEMYAKYADKIIKMVVRNNGTESDAADIFQDALVAIYQKAKKGNFVLTCPLEAYLYLICKNRWLNELKRQNKKVTFTDTQGCNYEEDVFKNTEVIIALQDRKKVLDEKFSELGDRCRQLLELSWSGISMEQVATALNNTYGYVRKKKSECIAKLVALVKASSQFTHLQW